MVQIQYWNGMEWVNVGNLWANERLAWISLDGDDINYRTIDVETEKTLTDKRI